MTKLKMSRGHADQWIAKTVQYFILYANWELHDITELTDLLVEFLKVKNK